MPTDDAPIPYPEPPSRIERLTSAVKAVDEAVSPTGTPLVPPRAVPWLWVVYSVLTGGGLMLLPEGRPLQIGTVASVLLGALLGVASPGLRRKT
jgi:hypothetical protein